MSKKGLVSRSLMAALSIVVSLVSVTSVAGAAPKSGVQPNIVGGENATQSRTVSLQSIHPDGALHECGGTLIAPQWVMTAAHCSPYIAGQARIGSTNWKTGGEVISVDASQIIVNPDHDSSKNFGNDIALVKLVKPSHYTPVAIGVYGPVGSQGLAQGWGITCDTDVNAPGCGDQVPDQLQQLQMTRTTDHYCDLVNSRGVQLNDPNTMMCLVTTSGAHAGICFGDSGSPYLQNIGNDPNKEAVTGIIIALMNNTVATPHVCSQTPSGDPNRDAATKVSSQLPWIIDTLNEHDYAASQYVQSHLLTQW